MRNFLHAGLGLFFLISTNNTQAQNESITILNDPIVTVLSETSVEITFETNVVSVGLVDYDSRNHSNVRMMPLGDSITKGVGSSHNGGYRLHLYTLLTNQGVVFDFVGEENSGSGLPDRDHEGHGGWRTNQIIDNIGTFFSNNLPEAVFLHIGTNDISDGKSAEKVFDSIITLISAIYNLYPDVKIYLSTLIPRRNNGQPATDKLNSFLPLLTQNILAANYEIYLVDNANRFIQESNWQSKWMDDHVHPNDDGYEVMAEQWFEIYSQSEYKYTKISALLTTAHVINLANLKPGTTYNFRAKVENTDGGSTFSNNLSFTTPGQTPTANLTAIGVFPDYVNLSQGQTQQFMALGFDEFGEPISVNPTWSAIGGAISPEGVFTANSGELIAITASDGSISNTLILNYSPRIEAESLTLTSFTQESNNTASNGQMISLKGGIPLENGTASGTFVSPSGNYKVVVGYFDENDDNEATISFFLNGNLIDNWQLDDPTGGSAGADASTFRQRTISQNINIQTGTTFLLSGQESQLEHVRIDYIDFIQAANLPPLAIATSDLTSGEAPLTVNFTGNGSDSDGSIASFSWDFGDGQSSIQ
ncbi:MAG: GDSL-type esterase/lipase family protein, partial [Bacteroidetes bacterium]|nr:GDSL-type esterase/lipase family protein [Bacteroidota bacterium]